MMLLKKYLLPIILCLNCASALASGHGKLTFHFQGDRQAGIYCPGNVDYEYAITDGMNLPLTGGNYNDVKKNILNNHESNTCMLYYPFSNTVDPTKESGLITLKLQNHDQVLVISHYEALPNFYLPPSPVGGSGTSQAVVYLPIKNS